MRRMSDRLPQLLDENPVLYGIIARDATPIDIVELTRTHVQILLDGGAGSL